MKKVIITGANGFLGKQILKKIDKQEFDVYSVISGRQTYKILKKPRSYLMILKQTYVYI